MAHIETPTPNPTPCPSWLRDCIIYELNPRTFTSPQGDGDGSGSGTFQSLIKKLPYLHSLGINLIWMAGQNECDSHFSNVWTVYAMRDPRKIDETLGTPNDLKELINAVHRQGMRIIGDVVTHGVTLKSSLLKEHPEWFSGGEWGMADFDYTNEEFRRWWIDLWTATTLSYGFDGWRLDGPNGVSSFADVLGVWDKIAWNCNQQGHPILVMGENSRYHIRQGDIRLFSHDMAADFSATPQFTTMQISCHDEGINMPAMNYYALRGSRFKFGYSSIFGYNIPLFMSGEEFNAGAHLLSQLSKRLYDGIENCREVCFYDNDPKIMQGGWLLGNQIEWLELDQKEHQQMLVDCRKILQIRNENSDILHYDRAHTSILSVDCFPKCGAVPYIRYEKEKAAILVVGNETPLDHEFIVRIPLLEMGFASESNFNVIDLWTGNIVKLSPSNLRSLRVFVPGDYKPGGGVRAYRIEPLQKM